MLAPTPLIDNLTRARNLIADPAKWCVGYRDDGQGRHCALGALDVTLGDWAHSDMPEVQLLAEASRQLHPEELLHYGEATEGAFRIAAHNNVLGHAATIAMFERAIALAALAVK